MQDSDRSIGDQDHLTPRGLELTFLEDPKTALTILEKTPIAIIITDGKGRIEFANQHTEVVFGYQVEELLGRSIETLIPERLRQIHIGHRDNYKKNPFTRLMGVGHDLLALKKSGEEIPVEIGLSHLTYQDNLRILCYITDISSRKNSEQTLISSEHRFRSLFNSTPDGVILTNQEGTIIQVNKTSEEVFGYPQKELLGKTLEFLIPDILPLHPAEKSLTDPTEGDNQHKNSYYELSAVRVDGSSFPVSVKISHFWSENDFIQIVIVRDISERRKVERELRLLGQIAKQMKDAVILTDNTPKSEIRYVNKAFTDLYGYTEAEVLGKPSWILFAGDDQERESISYDREISLNLQNEFRTRYQDRKKNGTPFWVSNTSSVIQLGEEEAVYDLGIVRDISKRIQFEELLEKQNAFLSTLHETSLQILSHLDLNEVLESMILKAIDLLDCSHGQILLFEGGALECKTAVGCFTPLVGTRMDIGDGFIGKIFKSGKPMVEHADQISMPEISKCLPEMVDCFMGVPLQAGDEVFGVICMAGNSRSYQNSVVDGTEMLGHLGKLASIATQNAQLFFELERSQLETKNQNKRMERELEIARKVQVALLPRDYPKLLGWSFAALWKPALEVAGDYYDFILRNDNCLDLIIADVTDKGVPAALYMAHSKVLLRSALESSTSLKEGAVRTNQLMTQEDVGPYVTCFLARINPENGVTTYVNAGHESTLVYRSNSDQITALEATGVPLGVDIHMEYEQGSLQLQSKDFMVLYTDGVREAMNEESKCFGKEALEKSVYRNRHGTADEIAQGLLNDVEAFIAPNIPSDDIAIVVVRRL